MLRIGVSQCLRSFLNTRPITSSVIFEWAKGETDKQNPHLPHTFVRHPDLSAYRREMSSSRTQKEVLRQMHSSSEHELAHGSSHYSVQSEADLKLHACVNALIEVLHKFEKQHGQTNDAVASSHNFFIREPDHEEVQGFLNEHRCVHVLITAPPDQREEIWNALKESPSLRTALLGERPPDLDNEVFEFYVALKHVEERSPEECLKGEMNCHSEDCGDHDIMHR
ncbi:MAG: hypothetical protein MHM6MM_000280 [Cercozoa sp. M6MM]